MFAGGAGSRIVSVLFIVSALGTLNGIVLSTSRVPFAMARDGLFFPRIARIGKYSRVPLWSVGLVSGWASVLALSGTFDQLTNMVIFALYLFHAWAAAAVMVLRRRMPQVSRPYKTPAYPAVPLGFIAVAVWLILNTLRTNPVESCAGVVLILMGLPGYLYFRRQAKSPANESAT